jgi:hypothetical protein
MMVESASAVGGSVMIIAAYSSSNGGVVVRYDSSVRSNPKGSSGRDESPTNQIARRVAALGDKRRTGANQSPTSS